MLFTRILHYVLSTLRHQRYEKQRRICARRKEKKIKQRYVLDCKIHPDFRDI